MDLKTYQKKILDDLTDYLNCLRQTENLSEVWKNFWSKRNIEVGFNGMPSYKDRLGKIPNICFKVPTGGGKTFLACSGVKKIFDGLKPDDTKFVIWLVPSETILSQTVKTLSDSAHPYHQKLFKDFRGRVEILTKEKLLAGQDFSPDSVRENLTICVMSYASVRINSMKKDVRKMYQENGILAKFSAQDSENLNDTPPSAPVQILRALKPVVIVDESHNADSELSLEMLKNLSPRFVLELTATPRDSSNIISYTEPLAVKDAQMIKLPVVVFKSENRNDMLEAAISFRNTLEDKAVEEFREGGKYIRPLLLFQAQPDLKDNSETFDKVKAALVKYGIPAKQIAVKTSNVNELKNIDLMSQDCAIRYIITVNALKEGWDCPFAYVLASLANKNSTIDVEQIVGRILRLPYVTAHKNTELNASYVFSCSEDFRHTLQSVVKGLNNAGFTQKDYRYSEIDSVKVDQEQLQLLLDEYNKRNKDNSGFDVSEVGRMKNQAKMRSEFAEDVANLKIPQFFQKISNQTQIQIDMFNDKKFSERILTPQSLSEGFALDKLDTKIDFQITAAKIDIEPSGLPFYRNLTREEIEHYQELQNRKTSEELLQDYKKIICAHLTKGNGEKRYGFADVHNYIDRVFENLPKVERAGLNIHTLPAYLQAIRKHIDNLEMQYREKLFNLRKDQNIIFCRENFSFKPVIAAKKFLSGMSKSLYESEGLMSSPEHNFIMQISALDNVKWWHRIIVDGESFHLNGFINHYPDFIVRTESGKIILIETKGDYLDGDDSKQKLSLGKSWENLCGRNYRYFMVFENHGLNTQGSYNKNNFFDVISKL